MLELAFVLARGQNWFFTELVAAVREELHGLGVHSSVTVGLPPEAADERIMVFVPPHEYVALEGERALPAATLLARSIFICAEQPATVHFDDDVRLARAAGAVFDLSPSAVQAFARESIAAEHFQVGYSPRWDHMDAERERDLDIVFLGSYSERRARVLAQAAPLLAHRNCHLQISDNSRPNVSASPSFFAEARWDLLTRAKVLLNVHQGEEPYFEWLRAIDAIHGGAVLVTEHSSGAAPLVAGEHFIAGHANSLPMLAEALLEDDDRLREIRGRAYQTVRTRLPLRAAVGRLLAAAHRLAATPLTADSASMRSWERIVTPAAAVQPAPADPLEPLRSSLKEVRLDLLDIRRRLRRVEYAHAVGVEPPRVRQVGYTSAWRADARQCISVLTALYNHRDLVTATLDSLLTSQLRELEVIVVDDGSVDGSGSAVRAWAARHDDVALLHLCHPINLGLGAARNTAMDFARAEYCFVLDADNEIYPRCLPALAGALDGSDDAAFAYPILEAFGQVDAYVAKGGWPLLSTYAWEPKRLRGGNYIDAMALIRTTALRDAGGYSIDRRLFGWEDYDLWCRFAEQGRRGIHVPQILGRYRASPASMLSLTDLSSTAARVAIVERHPELMAGITV